VTAALDVPIEPPLLAASATRGAAAAVQRHPQLLRACPRSARVCVLEYEFFSAACDLTLFTIEAALRVRFVEHYSRRIPVVARASKNDPLSERCM